MEWLQNELGWEGRQVLPPGKGSWPSLPRLRSGTPWEGELVRAAEAPEQDPRGRGARCLSAAPQGDLPDCHNPSSPAFSLVEPAWISLLQGLLCEFIWILNFIIICFKLFYCL